MPSRLFPFLAAVALTSALAAPASANTIFFGPTSYVQRSDSPFSGLPSSYFFLEDFEDGALNTPGVTASGGSVISGTFVDSVDSDDGSINGNGSTAAHSWYSNFTLTSFTFTFDQTALGSFPRPLVFR